MGTPEPAHCWFGQAVGESHYEPALHATCRNFMDDGEELECEALLVPESDNPHDDNAVRVVIDGRTVGHLSRKDALRFRDEMTKAGQPGQPARCGAPHPVGLGQGRLRGRFLRCAGGARAGPVSA